MKKNLKPSLFFLLISTIVATFLYFWLILPPEYSPEFDYFTAAITSPAVTPLKKELKPDSLKINFLSETNPTREKEYQADTEQAGIAPLADLDKELSEGIQLSPVIAGTWRWTNENQLQFTPKLDWPADQEYTINIDSTRLRTNARISTQDLKFKTAPFTAQVTAREYAVHPEDASDKKVVATLQFSHAVDLDSLRNQLQLVSSQSAQVDYELIPDLHQRKFYLNSEPLYPTQNEYFVSIVLNKGIMAATGKAKTISQTSESVTIPSLSTFFRIQSVRPEIINDEAGTPQQTLMLEFTDRIDDTQLAQQLELYLLPQDASYFIQNQKRWSNANQITNEVLSHSKKVDFKLNPTELENDFVHSIKLNLPASRQLFLHLPQGLPSRGGYELANAYNTVVTLPDYPKSLKIMSEGSLLSLAGDQQLPLVARGLNAFQVEIARVLPQHINHLISQTRGQLNNPQFHSYSFSKDNISVIDRQIVTLTPKHPAKPNYSSIDLSQEFDANDVNQPGLFLIEVQGWDLANEHRIYDQEVQDRRLVLITDMGLLIKTQADNTREVFVQSISTGQPVADANIVLLGANGIPLMSKTTSAQGHVTFPPLDAWQNEKQPIAFLAIKDSDLTFSPIDRHDRQINYSRFDTGGHYEYGALSEQISAFLFTDRGIYRPGETVQLAAVVKRPNFVPLPNFPLEWTVHNPQGQVLLKKRTSLGDFGFIELPFTTQTNSSTGNYSVDLYLPGKNNSSRHLGSVSFQLEEFQPDQLRITSRIEPSPNKGWATSQQLYGVVSLNNLFGSPAQNRKVTGTLQLTPVALRFPEFEGYRFTDPFVDQKSTRKSVDISLPNLRTDDAGKAKFDLDLQRYERGIWRVTLSIEGFEAGEGRSVRSQAQQLVSPYPSLLGYKADGDLDYIRRGSDRSLHYLNISSDLKTVEAPSLQLKLFQERPVSTLIKQPNGSYRYQSVQKRTLISESAYSIPAAGRTYALKTGEAGNFVVEIHTDEGVMLSRCRYTVAGEANLQGQLERNAELQLTLDRNDYKPGDTIEMNIVAPYVGSGLITIETNRVHHFKWFHTTTESSVQTIDVPHDLEGNAYVNVAFVRSIHSNEIYTSPLSYAVAPFSLDRSARTLHVELLAPPRIKPGEPVELTYQTSTPARIVLFAVSEGILQVANYQTPQPLNHFLQKRALQVSTEQMLDLILPDFSRVLETAAAGGGTEDMMKSVSNNLNPFARRLNKPAFWWSGIMDADRTPSTVTMTLPDSFNGEARIMAVAVSDSALGSLQKKAIVRGNAVITPNLPLAVVPGDRFEVTAGVANTRDTQSDSPDTLEVSLTTSAGLQNESPAQTLTLKPGDENTVTFTVTARDELGNADLIFNVTGAKHNTQRSVALSVRPASAYQTNFTAGSLNVGTHQIPLDRDLYPHLAQQKFSVSANPLVLTDGLITFLQEYPYLCTEQLISGVYPTLPLKELDRTNQTQNQVRHQVQTLVEQLRSRQQSDGGFSLWPGQRYSHPMPSLYAIHFLIDAQSAGITIPYEMLEQGKTYLKQLAGAEIDQLSEAQHRAWAIYLLTRQDEITTNYLVNLQEKLEQAFPKKWKTQLTSVYLAATWAMLQQQSHTSDLLKHYQFSQQIEQLAFYDSPLAHDSQYLYLLARHFPARLKTIERAQIERLAHAVTAGKYNTFSAAWAVQALAAYGKVATVTEAAPTTVEVTNSQGEVESHPLTGKPFASFSPSISARNVALNAPSPLFYLLQQSGFDRTVAASEEPIQNGLEVSREYLNLAGDPITEAQIGDDLRVRLKVRTLNQRYVEQVAVMDLLPAGFEVDRNSISRQQYGWQSDFIDIREDRVIYFGTFGPTVQQLEYTVKATATGDFTVPAVTAEAMYDRSLNARSGTGRFKVIRGK